MTGKLNIKAELAQRMQNAARDLHMELVAAGVDLKALVPLEEIAINETDAGVEIGILPAKGQKTAMEAAQAEAKAREAERVAAEKAEQARIEAEQRAAEKAERERIAAEEQALEERNASHRAQPEE